MHKNKKTRQQPTEIIKEKSKSNNYIVTPENNRILKYKEEMNILHNSLFSSEKNVVQLPHTAFPGPSKPVNDLKSV